MKKTQFYVPGAVICFITLMLYGPAIFFDYVWDDFLWLDSLKNHGGDILRLAFLEPFLIGDVYWRPLAEITLYIQPGERPQMLQHGINIALHLVNICLLMAVGSRAIAKGWFQSGKWYYFFISAFAIHPAFVEPVAWVSGRFDLLLTSAFLTGVLVLLADWQLIRRGIALSVIFLLALLIKETAVLFIPVFVGLLWLMETDTSPVEIIKREKHWIISMLVLAVLWLVTRQLILGGTGAGFLFAINGETSIAGKVYMVLSTIGAYAVLLVLPFQSLSALYPVDQMLDKIWFPIIGLLYLISAIWLISRDGARRKVGILMCLFLVSLILVLNIVNVGFPDNLIQNRYLYLASALVISGIFLFGQKFQLTRFGNLAFTTLAGGWLLLSILNINVTIPLWKNYDTLSQWFYLENPGNPYAANMRATYYLQAGYIETAIETAGEIAIHKPTHAAYIILGDGHFILGQCKDAYVYYQYAQDMGAFPVEEARGLIGMYKLKYHSDKEEAREIKQKITEVLADDEDQLRIALARLEKLENESIECRDAE